MPLAQQQQQQQPQIRVIVRLPYNRPDEPIPDPPRIEWNAEKEHFLWEVIAKSRVVEGAGTDWKGLANHLQVPLPYLLYRAQVRYEEDLRGLRTALSPTSPTPQEPVPPRPASPPGSNNAGGEYFPRLPTTEKHPSGRRDSFRSSNGGPMAASSSARPLTIRTRLNSLRSVSSPQKVTSSSVLTLQGPKRAFPALRPLSPTSSRPSPSSPSSGADGGSEGEEEEELHKLEEEERRIEEQEALERKLKNLELKMTRDALGLVSSPTRPPFARRDIDRKRLRLSSESGISSGIHHRLAMSRRPSISHTPSHHSLSSTTNSLQGSIPDIPSPPPELTSQPTSPMTRHLTPATSPRSPPAVSHNMAFGTIRGSTTASRRLGGNVRSDRGSEIGSTPSSFSDLSDASLSSAMESSLMSNIRGQSPRVSSFTRSNLGSRRPSAR
ncbi:uncharacterized protein PHACADRAFT_181810 [Phanerochaete carnosa HHB-10118-sp]|uniref:Autophagy-related protein 29 n=1 Tax=Phanerochaete carnosa (strain HHB-10118-sp) TaxID=650164 RepID=K5XAD1_PHACS|nr:uncharacterized protein PHACADRAFT_181810 [Phanerochaete carnosa HHB-10118-sp]EKM59867.1 hypothetical protein PHACADRAFT_181810 [Phanerochaete carnosa HHB-10118-sp]